MQTRTCWNISSLILTRLRIFRNTTHTPHWSRYIRRFRSCIDIGFFFRIHLHIYWYIYYLSFKDSRITIRHWCVRCNADLLIFTHLKFITKLDLRHLDHFMKTVLPWGVTSTSYVKCRWCHVITNKRKNSRTRCINNQLVLPIDCLNSFQKFL